MKDLKSSIASSAVKIYKREPKDIRKLVIKKVGRKHYLYAYTGNVDRMVIGSYDSLEEARAMLEMIKSTAGLSE